MGIRNVMVADSAKGREVQQVVDSERYDVWDEWVRGNKHQLLGQPGDLKSLIGRVPDARDANEAIVFSVSQAAYTEQILLERYYQPRQYDEFIPLTNEAGEWAETIEYEVFDMVGQAQDVSSMADDIPMADVAWARKSFPVLPGAAGYWFTNQELRLTAYLKRPLPERRMAAAVEMFQKKLDHVGLLGNATTNVPGLFSSALIAHATTPSGKTWVDPTNTPLAILGDLNAGMYNAWASSGFNVVPTHLLAPGNAWQTLSNTPMSSTYPEKTILKFFMENNLCKAKTGKDITVAPAYDLATAGVGATGRAMFYRKNPQDQVMHVPMPLRFGAPQLRGNKVIVPGEFRYTGTEFRRPTNAYYMDGVQ